MKKPFINYQFLFLVMCQLFGYAAHAEVLNGALEERTAVTMEST